MLTLAQLNNILGRVAFGDWDFYTGKMGEGFYLQIGFYARDNDSFELEKHLQKGRKWYVSRWATTGEVIQTALKATLSATEHEVREQFKVDGKAIFGPHMNIELLLDAADEPLYRKEAVA